MEKTEIQPALTQEEWARIKFPIGNLRGEDLENHGLAAVCLYDQPFGFTQEDVETVRNGLLEGVVWTGEENNPVPAHRARLNDIADRIQALLPRG